MKFSTAIFHEKLPHVGRLGPFLVSSLAMAAIFTFFLLYSPNPFRIIPGQGLGPAHAQPNLDNGATLRQGVDTSTQRGIDHAKVGPKQESEPLQAKQSFDGGNILARPEKEEEECDLFKGHWIPEIRGSLYTNSSCGTIPDSKNCFRHGREDTDFLNWRWKPEKCELPKFDPKSFLEFLRGKKMAFVGDSVARNNMESLLCLLSQEEIPQDVYKDSEDRFRTWYFPKHEVTLMMLWSKYLIVGGERISNGTESSGFNLKLDEVDDNWARHLPGLDYAIISAGHWFFRELYLHEGGNLTGCVYCHKQNVKEYDISFAFQKAFRTVFKHINECKNCRRLVTLLRTFSPAHFESGAWNTGGFCNRTSPLTEEEINLGSFDYEVRNIQVRALERAKNEGETKGKRFGIVDVTRAMLMRPDGHPGAFWGNKWMKGYNDCVHWCMPGPIDAWSDFLMAVLRKEAGLVSR